MVMPGWLCGLRSRERKEDAETWTGTEPREGEPGFLTSSPRQGLALPS